MSIRAVFLLIFSALLVLLGGILYTATRILKTQSELTAAEDRRYSSYKLADELRQSSDDLTRMARTYVVTGDPRYEGYFQRILDIRNGEEPRPEGYGGIYWDFVTASTEERAPDGETVALVELMRRLEFTSEELGRLREAQARSDALVQLETRAMNAVKGIFADAEGAYVVKGEPDMELARELMHGEDYHRAKAAIMEPISEFFSMVETRTASEIASVEGTATRLNRVGLGLTSLAVALIVLAYVLIRRRVVTPVRRLAAAAGRAETGEYSARVATRSADELGQLGRAFNQMSAAIERDIAEREESATELARAREAAEIANRAKSAFLANMSHELRTPMNAIIGYSEMLIEEMETEEHGEFVSDLQKIHGAGKHLLALINDILDLSKIEAGRMDLYLERFDLRQMLDEAVATVLPLVQKNGSRLVTAFEGELASMRADLTKLRQSLFNLLSNSAKFTDRGTITLAAAVFRRDDQDWIRLSVTDTGIGIPPDKQQQVFEEFSQADSSTTRNYGGTGLGLPISRRFCRMMGGDISLESEPGRGSTFTIELPRVVDALEAARARGIDPADSTADRLPGGADDRHPVLVIDDDEDARVLLRRTLEADGHSVITAASGEEGLSAARRHKPSLITLDVMMPGLDGWAVLRELKSDPELMDIPVVMVSVGGDAGMGFSLGAAEYLTKPVDRDRLVRLAEGYVGAKGHGRVLIVEDDEATRRLLRRTLERVGWQVDEAGNGREGLDRVDGTLPDLVLLDLMMPVMDGFEFMQRFQERDDGRQVPVVVLTAKTLTPEEQRFLDDHARRVIQKDSREISRLLADIRRAVAFRGGEPQPSE